MERFDAVTAANYCCSIFHTVCLISALMERNSDSLSLFLRNTHTSINVPCTHTHARVRNRGEMNRVLITESLQVSTRTPYTAGTRESLQRLCHWLCHLSLQRSPLATRCAVFPDITEGESIQSLKALWVIPVRGPSGRRSALLFSLFRLPERR